MSHSPIRIYLDNAASTPMDPEVYDYMRKFYCEWAGNPSATHAHGRALRSALEEARRTISGHLYCKPGEIVFTSGGTEADNLAIRGAVEANGIAHIISTRIEHHAVTHVVEALEAKGAVTVTYLDLDREGRFDFAQLEAALTANPGCLVSLMHANNEIGTVYDLHRIGTLCKAHGALFHSDTVQTMGHLTLNLQETPVDFITASAHKFYGPKGVGFLYVRKGVKVKPILLGGSQERELRAGTENVPAIAGMAFALDKCYKNLETKNAHLSGLRSYLLSKLNNAFSGILINGSSDPATALPTVLNVCMGSGGDGMLLFQLDLEGISVSGGSACSAGADVGSHVLRGIGVAPDYAQNAVRFSFGMQNTREEIDWVVAKLEAIVKEPVAHGG